MSKTLIIAHRGASGYAPENTMAAMQKAIQLGADGIEFDVHLTKDNEVIVCHDEKVDRTTDGSGFIKNMTLREIRRLNAGKWYGNDFANERVPTLREVLELVKGRDMLINIELKNGIIYYEGLEREVVDTVNRLGMKDNVIISSFNHHSLVKVKELDNGIKTAALYASGLIRPWRYAMEIGVDAIHPIYFSLTKELIVECKKRNIPINTYTVNDYGIMENIIKAGVDGVITNYPDRGKEIIQSL